MQISFSERGGERWAGEKRAGGRYYYYWYYYLSAHPVSLVLRPLPPPRPPPCLLPLHAPFVGHVTVACLAGVVGLLFFVFFFPPPPWVFFFTLHRPTRRHAILFLFLPAAHRP